MHIPPIPLVPTPDTPEARDALGFQWAPNEVGKRHRLGGTPDWIRGDETPTCSCGAAMNFYGQLDSIGDKICLADCGMIYVFVCFGCYETKSIFQTA